MQANGGGERGFSLQAPGVRFARGGSKHLLRPRGVGVGWGGELFFVSRRIKSLRAVHGDGQRARRRRLLPYTLWAGDDRGSQKRSGYDSCCERSPPLQIRQHSPRAQFGIGKSWKLRATPSCWVFSSIIFMECGGAESDCGLRLSASSVTDPLSCVFGIDPRNSSKSYLKTSPSRSLRKDKFTAVPDFPTILFLISLMGAPTISCWSTASKTSPSIIIPDSAAGVFGRTRETTAL